MPKRIKTPTIIQMESVECGAASLAIVLAYFGRIASLEEVRYECGVSRDGSKASNLVKVARRYGLVATGFHKEPAGLRDLPLPQILHWNFNHFVVLEGFRGKYVCINDPASGPRKVPWEELDRSFTGVTITLEKGPDFQSGGSRRSMAAALGRRVSGLRSALIYAALVGLFLVIPGLVLPALSKIFVDDVFIAGRTDWLLPLFQAMGVALLLQSALAYLQESCLLRLDTLLAVQEASRFFRHVLSLPVEFFNQRYGGEIGSRVEINDAVSHVISRQLTKMIVHGVMILFYAAIMLMYNKVLTLVGLFVAVLNMIILWYVSRLRIDRSKRAICEQGKLVGASIGGLQSIETLKATGRESDFFAKWSDQQARYCNAQQELTGLTMGFGEIPGLLSAVNTSVMLGVGCLQIMEGTFTVGGLVAFQILMPNLLQPVAQMVQMIGAVQNLEGDMDRLDDVLCHPIDPILSRDQLEAGELSVARVKLAGELRLEDVTFGYSRLEEPVIRDFSLTIRPGQRVAIVGTSGSGKSTLARLVAGLYLPWSGKIAIDGRSLDQIPRPLLTNSVAVVDQDIFLFEGSVKENLTLWDRSIPFEDVVAAARDAAIHDEISARPNGYESRVEEVGANFSGGQRQRLEIARALVNNPALLVLDEATSALDPTTEKTIADALRRRGCSCLIIAHRLSTIRDCDEIIILDRGRVVERGAHEEMMRTEGHYSRLIGRDEL